MSAVMLQRSWREWGQETRNFSHCKCHSTFEFRMCWIAHFFLLSTDEKKSFAKKKSNSARKFLSVKPLNLVR